MTVQAIQIVYGIIGGSGIAIGLISIVEAIRLKIGKGPEKT
jgi:hypothetical protein